MAAQTVDIFLKLAASLFGRSPEAVRARRRAAFAKSVTSVGDGSRIEDAPDVESHGALRIGTGFRLSSRFAVSRLRVAKGAVLTLGDDVELAFGAVLSAYREITIGDRVSVGPYVSIVDANMGDPDMGDAVSGAVPIRIGNDVQIGSRVTILKGSHIGDGAIITAGSVVAGYVPPRTTASGNPAQVVPYAPQGLVHEALYATVLRSHTKPAIVSGDQRLGYGGLWARVAVIARALAAQNVASGDRVMFFTASKTDFLAAFYACLARGAVAVPVPEGAARATVTDLAEASGARVLVTEVDLVSCFSPPLPADLRIVNLATLGNANGKGKGNGDGKGDGNGNGNGNGNGKVERDFVVLGLTGDSPALIMFTSGTTAKKKAVLLSHANLTQATVNINTFMQIDERICEYVSIPLSHSFGLGRARAVFAVGGTLVLQDGFLNAASMVKAIEQNACNALSAVPASLALFTGKLEPLLRRIGPQIRTIELGSAHMRPEHKKRLLEIFPEARICMHYGLTEASRSAFMEFRADSAKLDTVGRASPNVELRVVAPSGATCAPGEHGEIVVSGGHVSRGYWDASEMNARAFTDDGAFRTGDFGFLDDAGYLHLLGRKDEMINMGGIKISPLEIEDKLREAYPSLDVCVVGIPDPAELAGEIPVVAYAGEVDPPLTLPALVEALAQRVERTKLPRAVVRIERIPRTENGKPIRRELARMVVDTLKSGERLR
jgi:long-chain acyl-CoA synthetase